MRLGDGAGLRHIRTEENAVVGVLDCPVDALPGTPCVIDLTKRRVELTVLRQEQRLLLLDVVLRPNVLDLQFDLDLVVLIGAILPRRERARI